MFSRIFGKRDKSADAPSKEVLGKRASEAVDMAHPVVPERPPAAFPPRRAPLAKAAVGLPKSPLATSFPADHQIDFVLPTAPQPLGAELSLQQRREIALATVQQHHQRIANTIRTLWGYRECSVYINKLIMAGGDGMGHARVGFNQDAVEAMLALSDIHDAEFGAPSTLGGALGL